MPLDLRECRLIKTYLVATILATALWWAGLFLTDWVAPMSLGGAYAPSEVGLLLIGDGFSALLIPVGILVALRRQPDLLPALFWIHFGGQGYAFCVSISGAVIDPGASPGMFCMFFSAGAALICAVRVARLPLLWGPFRFKDAQTETVPQLTRRTVVQSCLMWLVFFLLIPLALSSVENLFGWRVFSATMETKIAAGALFTVAGAIGIWGGIEMARRGEGTPLPSVGTRKLVVTGPYRSIRNPMAVLAVIQGICVGVMFDSTLFILYCLLGAFAWDLLVRPLEEAHLTQKFGQEYRDYQQNVRCWLPRPADANQND